MTKLDGISYPKLFDFIIFMESESIVNEMLEYPMMPLYVVQKLLGKDIPHSITTRGPFGITQIFLADYLTTDADDFASAKVIKSGLVRVLPRLKSIPLFDVVAIMNWFERKGSKASSFEQLYDNYYGPYDGKPLSDVQARRVEYYCKRFPSDDQFWLNS